MPNYVISHKICNGNSCKINFWGMVLETVKIFQLQNFSQSPLQNHYYGNKFVILKNYFVPDKSWNIIKPLYEIMVNKK